MRLAHETIKPILYAVFLFLALCRLLFNIKDAYRFDAPLDLKLMGFPNEYSRVLLNMLSNAREAILTRSQAISGRVDIVLSGQDGMGCVSVCDNGGGITASTIEGGARFRVCVPLAKDNTNGKY